MQFSEVDVQWYCKGDQGYQHAYRASIEVAGAGNNAAKVAEGTNMPMGPWYSFIMGQMVPINSGVIQRGPRLVQLQKWLLGGIIHTSGTSVVPPVLSQVFVQGSNSLVYL